MDLALTESQLAECAALRAFLAERCPPSPPSGGRPLEADGVGFPADFWRELQGRGWLATGPLLDLALRFREFGRAAAPGPWLAHFESVLVLAACGAKLPEDAEYCSVAVLEATASMDLADTALSYTRDGEGYTLTGSKLFVPWADGAAGLLVVARAAGDGALSLLRVGVDAAGVTCGPLASLGSERLFEVRFEAVRVAADGLLAVDAQPAIEAARARATLLACAELAGMAEAALDLAVDHARTREQFGRPIGAFQAVAHHCANMAMDVDAAVLAVLDATQRVDAGEAPLPHAAHAKVVCGEAARRVTTTAHQVMGGVGYLADTGLEHFTRQVKALESRLGTPDWHRERLADALGLQESAR